MDALRHETAAARSLSSTELLARARYQRDHLTRHEDYQRKHFLAQQISKGIEARPNTPGDLARLNRRRSGLRPQRLPLRREETEEEEEEVVVAPPPAPLAKPAIMRRTGAFRAVLDR